MGITDKLQTVLGRDAGRPETRVRAVWNGAVLAESDDTVVVEGNHYFPSHAVSAAHLEPNADTSVCRWKGTASYFDVIVGDERNPSAAWTYPTPRDAAEHLGDRIAFWKGVRVEPSV